MNKIISLIKASFNQDMNIFKINTKKQNNFYKYGLPIILVLYIMFIAGVYAEKFITLLEPVHLEFVVLTIFTLSVSIITLMEGIYKSSALFIYPVKAVFETASSSPPKEYVKHLIPNSE